MVCNSVAGDGPRHHLVAALAFLCALRMQVWELGADIWVDILGDGQVEI